MGMGNEKRMMMKKKRWMGWKNEMEMERERRWRERKKREEEKEEEDKKIVSETACTQQPWQSLS